MRRPFFLRSALLSVLLLALALRAWDLDRWSLWYDEAYCWWAASQVPLHEMLALSAREIIPPFYYLMLRLWIPIAGATEFALRWPSVLLGVFSVACAGRLAWRLTGRRMGALAATLLFAAGPPFLWTSREVRMYGPALAWTLLADVALLEVFVAPSAGRRRFWSWLWASATLAGLYTLTLTGFWLVGQALIGLVLVRRSTRLPRRSPAEGVRTLLLPALTVAFFYLPWGWTAMRMVPLNRTYWHGRLSSIDFLRRSLDGLTMMGYLSSQTAVTVAALMLAAALLALVVSRPRLLAGLYPLLYGAPLFLIALAYQKTPKWGARHASLFAPVVFLPLAVAWGSVRNVRRCWLRGVSLFILVGTTALYGCFLWEADRNLLIDPAHAREDWRGVARYVQEHGTPGDVVVVSTGSVFPAWVYYAGDEGLLPLPNEPLLDVTHVLTYPEVARQLNAALVSCRPCDVWLVAWLDDVTDPTGLVETLLEERGEERPVPDFRGLKVRRFRLERPPDFPADPPAAERPDVELQPGLRLWGYTLPDDPHPADRPLELRLWWVTEAPERLDARTYRVSLRLRDALGIEWGQSDRMLTGGNYRPDRWSPGVPVLTRLSLELPAGIPPGIYTPVLILYTPEATERVALRPVTVAPPAIPPEVPEEFTPARVGGGGSAPLTLLGVHLFQDQAAMCGRIGGELFWEVRGPLREEDRVVVAVGPYREESPLIPRDAVTLLRPGDRIRSYFQLTFPCRVLDFRADLEVRLLRADGEETDGIWYGPPVVVQTERVFTEPAIPYEPVGAEFGPGFATLLGYSLDPSPVRAGEPFTVTLIWRAGITDDVPRSVFVHIAPPGAPSPLIAQHDGWPVLGGRPTHTWTRGEVIVDPHPLPGLPAGTYRVRVGLYSPGGERLPVTVGGESPPDRALSFPLAVGER